LRIGLHICDWCATWNVPDVEGWQIATLMLLLVAQYLYLKSLVCVWSHWRGRTVLRTPVLRHWKKFYRLNLVSSLSGWTFTATKSIELLLILISRECFHEVVILLVFKLRRGFVLLLLSGQFFKRRISSPVERKRSTHLIGSIRGRELCQLAFLLLLLKFD